MSYTNTPQNFAQMAINMPWKDIFQRLPGAWALTLIPFSLVGPVYAPVSFGAYYVFLHIMFMYTNMRLAYGM